MTGRDVESLVSGLPSPYGEEAARIARDDGALAVEAYLKSVIATTDLHSDLLTQVIAKLNSVEQVAGTPPIEDFQSPP